MRIRTESDVGQNSEEMQALPVLYNTYISAPVLRT
jgi:hypothetical protein